MALSGQLDAKLLATIPGTSRRIRLDLLPSVVALRAAFLAHFGKPLVITDGYRPYDEQVALFLRYYTTTYLPNRPSRDWRGVRYWQRAGMPSAAVPGTSNHGWAEAIDFGSGVNTSLTSAEHLWMRANAPRFGWTHPAWAHDHDSRNGTDEPWHFEGVVVPASNYIGTPGVPLPAPKPAPLPTPPAPEEDVMGATWTEVRAGVAEIIRTELAAAARPAAAFRLKGTNAVYLDLGTARRHASAPQLAAHGIGFLDLEATDPFWRLPIVGTPGELYRQTGDATGAAFVLEGGHLRHVTAEEHVAMGNPPIFDVPVGAPLWNVPKLP